MYLVFDIETKNTFDEVGSNNPKDLETSYVGYYRSDTQKYEGVFEDEIVSKLFPILKEAEQVIGYNIIFFDIPALTRYGELNIPKERLVDLYKITSAQTKVYTKLDNWAQATLGKGKIGHGLDAIRYWREKDLDSLVKYCNMDVEITKELFEYVEKNHKLKYTDGLGKIQEVEVTIPKQEAPASPLQSSMF